MTRHLAIYTHENDHDGGHYADEVHVSEKPERPRLLGPDGNPLPPSRPEPRFGFDLRRRRP